MDTQPDRPSTPSAALLAFADELDDILDPTVVPPATIATIVHMARERAHSLTDEPDAPQPIETYGVELVGTPALDVDQQIRVEALRAAARFCASSPDTIADVVDVAHTFEAYLRGDR